MIVFLVSLHEDLHVAMRAKNNAQRGLLLEVVVGQYDETLLVGSLMTRDALGYI